MAVTRLERSPTIVTIPVFPLHLFHNLNLPVRHNFSIDLAYADLLSAMASVVPWLSPVSITVFNPLLAIPRILTFYLLLLLG